MCKAEEEVRLRLEAGLPKHLIPNTHPPGLATIWPPMCLCLVMVSALNY